MSLESALFHRLTNNAGVSALIATRMYPQVAPKSSALPRIVYTVIAQSPETVLSGESGLLRTVVQVDCWAETAAGATALKAALRNAMGGYRGTMGGGGETADVRRVTVDDRRDNFEASSVAAETGLYRASCDVEIWHAEAVPALG